MNIFKAYLKDIHLINEDRNFFGTFECPDDLKDLDLDAEELECRILAKIEHSDIKSEFNELFDKMKIDEEHPEHFEIHFHFNHDDYTEDDKEEIIQKIQNIL
jgi:hypothetical protein